MNLLNQYIGLIQLLRVGIIRALCIRSADSRSLFSIISKPSSRQVTSAGGDSKISCNLEASASSLGLIMRNGLKKSGFLSSRDPPLMARQQAVQSLRLALALAGPIVKCKIRKNCLKSGIGQSESRFSSMNIDSIWHRKYQAHSRQCRESYGPASIASARASLCCIRGPSIHPLEP